MRSHEKWRCDYREGGPCHDLDMLDFMYGVVFVFSGSLPFRLLTDGTWAETETF